MSDPGDRLNPQSFQAYYQSVPPWDIGRPQEVFVALVDAGQIRGRVLDVGCGTGENALFLASRGCLVVGIDLAPAAIEQAQRKARERASAAVFEIADALKLAELGRTFDAVIDCGVFHVFSDQQRPLYVASLAAVLAPGGKYFMLVFSDEQPGTMGPRRVSQREIREAFADGWTVEEIAAAEFSLNPASPPTRALGPSGTAKAWRSTLTRK